MQYTLGKVFTESGLNLMKYMFRSSKRNTCLAVSKAVAFSKEPVISLVSKQ